MPLALVNCSEVQANLGYRYARLLGRRTTRGRGGCTPRGPFFVLLWLFSLRTKRWSMSTVSQPVGCHWEEAIRKVPSLASGRERLGQQTGARAIAFVATHSLASPGDSTARIMVREVYRVRPSLQCHGWSAELARVPLVVTTEPDERESREWCWWQSWRSPKALVVANTPCGLQTGLVRPSAWACRTGTFERGLSWRASMRP